MTFEWTVSLGAVLQLAGLLVAIVWGYAVLNGKVAELRAFVEEIRGWHLVERLTTVETKMDALWDWFTNNLECRHAPKSREPE